MRLTIELDQETHDSIYKLAEAEKVTVEEYIAKKIEGGKLQEPDLRDFFIKELKSLLEKIQRGTMVQKTRSQRASIKLYSYAQFNKKVPKEIESLIADYRHRGWLYGDHFYLIMEDNKLVGYLGFSPHSESMPYGSYLFIYHLYVMESHQSMENIVYLRDSIQAIAKKISYQSIDISSLCSNLKEEQLRTMGFLPFEQTILFKGSIKRGDMPKSNLKEVPLSDNWSLEDRLVLGRSYPMDYWIKKWEQKKGFFTIKSYRLEKASLLVAREYGEGERIIKYTLFLEANKLFDQDFLNKLKDTIIPLLSSEGSDKTVQIALPLEMNEGLGLEGEKQIKAIHWYRKMIY